MMLTYSLSLLLVLTSFLLRRANGVDESGNYSGSLNATLVAQDKEADSLDFEDEFFDEDVIFEFTFALFEFAFDDFTVVVPPETELECEDELDQLDRCFDEDKNALRAKKLFKCLAFLYDKMENGNKICDENFFPCQAIKSKCSKWFNGCYVETLNFFTCLTKQDFDGCSSECNHPSWVDASTCLDKVEKQCSCPLVFRGSQCWERVMRQECVLPDDSKQRNVFRNKLLSKWRTYCNEQVKG